jgi:hypothetical protein
MQMSTATASGPFEHSAGPLTWVPSDLHSDVGVALCYCWLLVVTGLRLAPALQAARAVCTDRWLCFMRCCSVTNALVLVERAGGGGCFAGAPADWVRACRGRRLGTVRGACAPQTCTHAAVLSVSTFPELLVLCVMLLQQSDMGVRRAGALRTSGPATVGLHWVVVR